MAQQDLNVTIAATDGSGRFGGYLAVPEGGEGPGLVLIQEIFGVNKNMRDLADMYAGFGFVVLVPDLFWRIEPAVDLTDQSQEEWDKAFALFNAFDQDKGVTDIQASISYLRDHDATNGKVGCVGFCLGGRMAFRTACETDIDASVSYYGVGLEGLLDQASAIKTPTVLHIAEEDQFVPKEAQAAVNEALGNHNQVSIFNYAGVDHGFARAGGAHFDEAAAAKAQERTLATLNGALRS